MAGSAGEQGDLFDLIIDLRGSTRSGFDPREGHLSSSFWGGGGDGPSTSIVYSQYEELGYKCMSNPSTRTKTEYAANHIEAEVGL